MEFVAKLLLVFFLVMGLVETCRLLLFWLLRPEKAAPTVQVVPLSGHVENAEYLLRGIAEKMRWEKPDCRLVCVDGGMDWETREICLHLQREIPFLEFCRAEELGEWLFSKRETDWDEVNEAEDGNGDGN